MRILDLTGIYPNEVVDFEGRSVAALNHAWQQLGHEVTVIVLKPWLPRWLAARIPKYRHLATRDSVELNTHIKVIFSHYWHVPKLPNTYRFKINVTSMARHIIRLYRQHHMIADLIHAEGLTMGLAATVVAAELGIPFFITLRDDLNHLSTSPLKNHLLYQRCFSEVESLFCIGPAQYEMAPNFLPANDSSKVYLAPNGVHITQLEQLVSAFPPHQPASIKHIVSVSSLFRWKGIHENLRAMHKLMQNNITNWHYRIIGDGPYRDELEALTIELNLQGHVSFLGRLMHQETLQQISNADIFCLPSFMEAFGNVFAEAAICGVPAIGCYNNGPELIIDHQKTGLLVSPRNIDELADALAYLLTHADEAQQMGARARQHIRQFTWEKTAHIYQEVFEQKVSLNAP